MITIGIDIGSLTTKAVVLRDRQVAGWSLTSTGDSSGEAARRVTDEALKDTGITLSDVASILATGVGRSEADIAQQQATEVICAAKGAQFLSPEIKGVIDMGAESTQAVRLDNRGDVMDFALNDKCAAGTGIFLDAMGKVMGVKVGEMGPLSLKSTTEVNITSTCVVFAESEVVSQVHRGIPKVDILKGIHKSIATRVYGLAGRVGLNGDNMAIGGLAMNIGVVTCLEELMKEKLIIPDNPQTVTALGAAIVAAERGVVT